MQMRRVAPILMCLYCSVAITFVSMEWGQPVSVAESSLASYRAAYIYPYCPATRPACLAGGPCVPDTCTNPSGKNCVTTPGTGASAPAAGACIGQCATTFFASTCTLTNPCGATTIPQGCNNVKSSPNYCTPAPCGGSAGTPGC